MTNFEKIKSMTLEELSEFLCDISDCSRHRCPMYKECDNGDKKKWLKNEAD